MCDCLRRESVVREFELSISADRVIPEKAEFLDPPCRRMLLSRSCEGDTEMATHEWEPVGSDTERMRVPGGWLYRYTSASGDVALVFVPTPKRSRR